MRHAPLSLAALLILSTLALPVSAQSGGRQDERDQAQRQASEQRARRDDDRELSDAVRRVVREQRGRVLSAERVQYEGREVNRIKVIDEEGRVRVYMDDPVREEHRAGSRETP